MEKTTTPPQGAPATDRVLEALSTLAVQLDSLGNEVKALDSEFQNRLLQAVHDAESSLQNQADQDLESALRETAAKLDEKFKAKLAELSAEWEAERSRLNGEVERLSNAAIRWETESKRLSSDLERLAQMHALTQAQAEKAVAAVKAAAAISVKLTGAVASEPLATEVQRIEGLIEQIAALMDDPTTDLATVIRKSVEKAELESYLRGIRFALNGGGNSGSAPHAR